MCFFPFKFDTEKFLQKSRYVTFHLSEYHIIKDRMAYKDGVRIIWTEEKRDSGTAVFLWVLWNFQEHLFW